MSPAQVLPQGNTATVRSAWHAWTVMMPGGSGRRIDPQRKLDLRGARWPGQICCRDAAIVMDCVMGLEERTVQNYNANVSRDVDGDNDRRMDLFSGRCAGHVCVLSLKPLMKSFSSELVRLGHQLQNGRTKDRYGEMVAKQVSDTFTYKLVDVFPPEVEVWRQENKRLLVLSRASQTLTEKQEDDVCAADNGSWKQKSVVHYCSKLICPLQCKEQKRQLGEDEGLMPTISLRRDDCWT